MARICEICERGPQRANLRSHSMRATPRRVHVNLQMKTIEGKRTRMCTRCIRTTAKKAAKAQA